MLAKNPALLRQLKHVQRKARSAPFKNHYESLIKIFTLRDSSDKFSKNLSDCHISLEKYLFLPKDLL